MYHAHIYASSIHNTHDDIIIEYIHIRDCMKGVAILTVKGVAVKSY